MMMIIYFKENKTRLENEWMKEEVELKKRNTLGTASFDILSGASLLHETHSVVTDKECKRLEKVVFVQSEIVRFKPV
jgi:hypothetical protein